MKDLKYLVSYLIPITVVIGLNFRGVASWLAPFTAFVLVPILEIIFSENDQNLSPEQAQKKQNKFFFDLLLYLNLPFIYLILGYFLWSLTSVEYATFEVIGLTFSVGVALGSNGINVAHELGHRQTKWEQFLAKVLLLPALYMHFFIEHNFGHHLNAATAEDPASAKYNQTVYGFWVTSTFGQYVSAWKIQNGLLKRQNSSFLSIKNDMFWYSIFQLVYLFLVFFLFGFKTFFVAICIGVVSILLLETINYIEHYGLSRNKTESGRYERVMEIHSWNSNHVLGRMMLYELTRHSDHHKRAHKKYQLLDCHEISPQMPYGYPTSMVLSLFPPVWFKIMNPRIPLEMRS